MVLHDAVKRDQVAVDVVEDFDGRWLRLHEVERRTAGKDFNIAFVWGKKRNEAIGQAAFAAHPRDDGCRHESKTITVWINRRQARRALCTEQEPWLDLQGPSAGTAVDPDVDASGPAALFHFGVETSLAYA